MGVLDEPYDENEQAYMQAYWDLVDTNPLVRQHREWIDLRSFGAVRKWINNHCIEPGPDPANASDHILRLVTAERLDE